MSKKTWPTGPKEMMDLYQSFTVEELHAAISGKGDLTERFEAQFQAWEAERAEAKEIRQLGMRYMVDLASMTARAERAEAVLEQVQNALLVRDHQHQATKAELEQARALLAELEWCGVDNWLECPWCLGTKAEHYGEPAGHKPDCKLAAFLAAGGEQP